MNTSITRKVIEKLVAFSVKHSLEDALLSYPMFDGDTIAHLYNLTEKQRSELSNHLFLRSTFGHSSQASAIPTPIYGLDETDVAWESWEEIVRLYEDS